VNVILAEVALAVLTPFHSGRARHRHGQALGPTHGRAATSGAHIARPQRGLAFALLLARGGVDHLAVHSLPVLDDGLADLLVTVFDFPGLAPHVEDLLAPFVEVDVPDGLFRDDVFSFRHGLTSLYLTDRATNDLYELGNELAQRRESWTQNECQDYYKDAYSKSAQDGWRPVALTGLSPPVSPSCRFTRPHEKSLRIPGTNFPETD
jgi:hypothetical protein